MCGHLIFPFIVSHKIHKTLDVAEDEWVIIPNHHRAIIDKEDLYKSNSG